MIPLKRSCIFLSAIIFLSACSKNAEENYVEEIDQVKLPLVERPDRILNAAFLIMDGVFNTELTAPIDIFQHSIFHTEYGIQIFTVAEKPEMVTTFEGLRIIPDYTFDHDSLPDIDILVIPSAEHHLDTDLENEVMINWVRETGINAQYVMSLCDGAFVLAKAGLLDGVQCTTFPGDIEQFRTTFPQLDVKEGVSFVHDGKMITSAGGAKSFDPALYLSELLYGKKAADGIAGGLVIDWNIKNIACVIVN
jgi:transcriptional regulator GlxA family with amidase domain